MASNQNIKVGSPFNDDIIYTLNEHFHGFSLFISLFCTTEIFKTDPLKWMAAKQLANVRPVNCDS